MLVLAYKMKPYKMIAVFFILSQIYFTNTKFAPNRLKVIEFLIQKFK